VGMGVGVGVRMGGRVRGYLLCACVSGCGRHCETLHSCVAISHCKNSALLQYHSPL